MRKGVQDYFEQALRRAPHGRPASRARLLATAPDGAGTEFEVQITGDRISGVEYRSTPCVTLIALCEHLRELMLGAQVEDGSRLGPETLLALHPEIPSGKQGRARLACDGFGLALKEAITGRTD